MWGDKKSFFCCRLKVLEDVGGIERQEMKKRSQQEIIQSAGYQGEKSVEA